MRARDEWSDEMDQYADYTCDDCGHPVGYAGVSLDTPYEGWYHAAAPRPCHAVLIEGRRWFV